MIMPGPIELTALMASAPASAAALHTSPSCEMLGETLTKTGSLVAFLTAAVMEAVASGVPCPASNP